MSASIRRINTCENCVYSEPIRMPDGRLALNDDGTPKLNCRYEPPIGHPIVAFVPDENGGPAPRILGTIAVWPEVRVEQWCGRHASNKIEKATVLPEQMQTFGGLHRG
jgi:hypothetical protein